MPLGQLAQVLRGLGGGEDERLLVGPHTVDDAGVVTGLNAGMARVTVVAHDRNDRADRIAEHGVTACPMADLLAQSDFVSLHCPLTEETRNLFGAEQFRAMKEDAILINTARGGLVDSQALVDALAIGEIAAAAVDVLPSEPPIDGDPLLDYKGPNLIVTPHIAWATDTARQNAIDELAANTRAFLAGKQRDRIV